MEHVGPYRTCNRTKYPTSRLYTTSLIWQIAFTKCIGIHISLFNVNNAKKKNLKAGSIPGRLHPIKCLEKKKTKNITTFYG